MVIQGIKYPSDFEAKKAMIDTAKRLSDKGYLIGTDGSLSVRVGPNAIWITIADADKGALTQDMMVRVDMNGKQMMNSQIKALPEDLPMHLKAYGQNNSLRCVIHAYPPMANAMGIMGKSVNPASYSPSVRKLGVVSVIPGLNADAAANQISSICSLQKGVLLQSDGCVFWGESVNEAYYNIEALEYYAKMEGLVNEKHCCGKCSGAITASVNQTSIPAISQLKGVTPLVRPEDGPKPIAKATPMPQPIERATPMPQPIAKTVTLPQPIPASTQNQEVVAVKDVAKEIVMQEVVNRTLMKFKK